MGLLEIVKNTIENCNGFSLTGWEPERLAELETTLTCLNPLHMALGFSEKIEGMVKELLAGPGAVRATLKRYLAN